VVFDDAVPGGWRIEETPTLPAGVAMHLSGEPEIEKRDVEKSEPIVETYDDGLTIDSAKFQMMMLQAIGELAAKVGA
jgi:hypothetical protein